MEFLIKASQFILSLSFLIVLHELGHFIPARLFKIKVEKFYLFFNPWFSIFKRKRGDTEYGLGWLPLGGYVKIAGMIDESMDKEQLKKDPEPWEFRSKPAWQRLIVMVGGVTVNLILGFLIYIMVLFVWGRETMPVAELEDGYAVDSLMYEYGFRDGDIITHVHGKPLEDAMEINKLIFVRGKTEFTVKRNDFDTLISLPDDFQYILLEKGIGQPFTPRFRSSVDSVVADSPAEKAGLLKGDVIKEINGTPTPYWNDATRIIKSSIDKEISILAHRLDKDTTILVKTDDKGMIGIAPESPDVIFDFEEHTYGFFEAIPAGLSFGVQTLSDYAANLKFLFTSSGAKQIGGFGTIGGLFPAKWDWRAFWSLTAFLSIVLAFMNILPIPALDGGHVMFLLYEMITRRKPNQKVMEYAQMVGMILLIGLILFANFNDIRRFLF